MTEAWKQWEGQVVNAAADGCDFHLRQYLGGSERSAVFLTELGPELQRAAIKLVPADPADAEAQLSRWQRIARLSHPHLLRLFQTGRCRIENTELLFAVMEYAEEDLSQILPERPLTPSETRDMLKPTLDVLAYLHEQGFVHGHLKPSNIMAIKDQLKLASDGLYAAGERVTGHERSAYDPPEISTATENATREIAPSADVWSLGMTLVEILTRNLPAWSETELADPAAPQNLPEPFLDIVRNCLRRNPQQRWTIANVASRLNPPSPAAPKPGPVPAPVKQDLVKAKKASARWRFIVPAAVAAFAGALLAGSGILHRQQPAQPQPQTQSGEDTPVTKPAPDQDTEETNKPSPGTPLKDQRGNIQGTPSVAHASTPPSAPSEPEVNPATGSSEHDGIVQQVLPEVPQKARDTIQGKIKAKVRVHVDALGNVSEAEIDSPGPSKYFAQLALQAAQRWKFMPVQSGAQNASREWLLRFEFGSAQTRVYPSAVAPNAR